MLMFIVTQMKDRHLCRMSSCLLLQQPEKQITVKPQGLPVIPVCFASVPGVTRSLAKQFLKLTKLGASLNLFWSRRLG